MLLDISFNFHSLFLVFFPSFLSMRSDDFDSVTNNLRDSAKGRLVTYDDTFPLTVLLHNEFWPFLGPLIFSMFSFYPITNFGHFGAPPSPSTKSRTMEVGAQKESQEELPGNEEQKKTKKTIHRGKPRQTEIKQQRKTHCGREKQHSPCFLVKSTAYARSGVQG